MRVTVSTTAGTGEVRVWDGATALATIPVTTALASVDVTVPITAAPGDLLTWQLQARSVTGGGTVSVTLR